MIVLLLLYLMHVFFHASPPIGVTVCMSVCLSACLSVSLPDSLSVHVYSLKCLLIRLFSIGIGCVVCMA